ncbi:aryl-phospho-beta-D-glucosidase BglC (GH1 family) [Pseudomonas duriflava]|uniref:Aryl-phospho-beta-D-glucosidase BglC (GH1 family) n=1 Tax=Pseudomonas duriflava TaxID=459528 RepID=A0A562Q6L3_9PSED|nr:glycoside hydrolase family 5 protein [Pseudomonas duriflava]TWI52348.1 aryl-phospho-beta-D-glucosidase BglC (GH1 family) [Pseudomonas duriflava]
MNAPTFFTKLGSTRFFKKALPFVAVAAFGSTAVQAEQIDLVSLNLSGAGFAPHVLPGINGTNYIFPVESYFQQWSARGIKTMRFPIIWERLQPKLGGPLDPTYVALIDRTFGYAQKHNVKIILDLHNYAKYRGQVIGTSSVPYARYQEIMTKIAQQWSKQPALYAYDIMNEPNGALAYWPTAAQYGINGVRAVDKTRPIIVEGNGWASATRWAEWNDSLLNLKDPSNNIIFSAHSYFDENAGGSYDSVDVNKLDAMYGVNRVKPFVEWLKKHGKRGYIGEFGVPDNNPRWNLLMDNMLAYLKQNCIPASYWAAGPGWGSYFMSVEPVNGKERPQWATLKKYVDNTSCSAYGPLKAGTTTPTTSSGTGSTPVATTPSTTTGSSSGSTTAPTTSTSTAPSASASSAVTSTINNFTNADWLNGVYRKKPGFSIPATAANKAAFKVGASVKLANGEVRKITYVQIGNNMGIYLDGAVLNGTTVGYPKTLTLVSSTATSTASTPSTTTAKTSTAATTVVTSTINNFTNADWLNGVYRKKPGFSIPATAANKAAFKVGASVKMANGQVRKITYVQIGKNMGVYLDGAVVSGSTVGYPKTLTLASN